MIKLYGFPVSNYFNVVKLALMEKGVDFTFVPTKTSQELEYLEKSPMGKVPCIETESGFLSETSVILDYIEDTQGGLSLYPQDPYQRAQVKQLIKLIELYIELPARSCYNEVFFNGQVSDEVKQKAKETLQKGVRSIKLAGSFSPYLAGDSLSYADLMFMYSIDLASIVAKKLWDIDLLADIPEAGTLLASLNEREHAVVVNKDKAAQMAEFMAAMS